MSDKVNVSWDYVQKYEEMRAENARLRALLCDALPFVNDAGDDEDPEAKANATEIAEEIRHALEKARKKE